MNEFIYDLGYIIRELEDKGIKVPTTATIINKIKRLKLYNRGEARKFENGFITTKGKKGSKWLLTEDGMNELIDELTKKENTPGMELFEGDYLLDHITITPEIREPVKNKKGRLRKTDHNSYLVEVDAEIVNKFQAKGYKWKEDISRLINSLLESQYQVYDAIEKKTHELYEAREKAEQLQKELEMMNEKIGV